MFDLIHEYFLRLVHILTATSRLTYASVGVGLLVAFLYFKLIFQDVSQFKDDSKNAAKLYLMEGRLYYFFRWASSYTDFQWSLLKLFIWTGLSIGSGMLAYHQLPHWLPRWFPK